MFFPPSFEPHSPIEPQWFPRPITDSFESLLDQLERLEEDRKRRLRSIANVSAKNPIGFCGESAGNSPAVPGTAAASVPGNHRHSQNSYSQHRYYPPPAEESTPEFHRHQQDLRAAVNPAPALASTSSRRRHYRNIRATRPSANSSSIEAAVHTSQRDDNPATNLSHLSHSHISHDVSNIRSSTNDSLHGSAHSFTITSPLFHSPPLDPRGGGGRRNSGWYHSQLRRNQLAHYQQHPSYDTELTTPTNLAFLAGDQSGAQFEITTPEDQGVSSTPGHGHSEDVYSQRRRGQRRRRVE